MINLQIFTISGNNHAGLNENQAIASCNLPPPPNYNDLSKENFKINESEPPSYESLFKNKESRKKFIINFLVNIKKDRFKIMSSIILVLVFIISPIINIYVGVLFRNDCPIEISVPIWLIVDGIFVLLLAFFLVLSIRYDCTLPIGAFSLFLFLWLIKGCLWVFRINSTVIYDSKQNFDQIFFCNQVCFLLAFWTITLACCFVILMFLYSCFTLLYKCIRIPNKNNSTIINY